jgi:hypothetical protein
MVRFKIIISLLCISLCGFAQNNSSISNQKLISSGINRLSGIYILMNDWDTFTFDGYRWYASANGLSTLQSQNWILMLDGQLMEINFFSLNNINILPLTINHIDSLETVNHPKIVAGKFTSNGLINIRTLKPKNGLSVTGRYTAGNETGDPGPYFYTEHRSSNVEEDGPNLSASIEYGFDDIWARLFFYTEAFSATDTAMRKRNPQLDWEDFKGRRFSPSLQVGFNALNGIHNLFFGYSTSEIQPFHPRTYTSNDLIFINPAVKDYPVQMIFKHAGLNGDFNLTSTSQINYSIKVSSNKLYSAKSKLNNFDYLQTNYYSNLGYYNKGRINYFLGACFDHTELSASYSSLKKGITLTKTFGGIDFNSFENVTSRIGTEILFAKNKKAFRGYLNSRWQYINKLWFDLNLALIQTLPEEKNDLWYWIENDYDVLKVLNVKHSFSGGRKKELKFTADLNANYKLNPSLKFNLGALYRNFSNYLIEEVIGIYNPDSSFFNSFVNANTNSYGSAAGFSIRIHNRIISSLTHSLDYRFLTSVSGDSSFKNEWETFPSHKLNYMVTFYPFESFSLLANLTFLSPVSWSYYPKMAELSEGFYKNELDERFILDLSIRKWFWNNRLRFNLLFKNILNNELKYHPLGSKFYLSVFFTAELVFNSIIE